MKARVWVSVDYFDILGTSQAQLCQHNRDRWHGWRMFNPGWDEEQDKSLRLRWFLLLAAPVLFLIPWYFKIDRHGLFSINGGKERNHTGPESGWAGREAEVIPPHGSHMNVGILNQGKGTIFRYVQLKTYNRKGIKIVIAVWWTWHRWRQKGFIAALYWTRAAELISTANKGLEKLWYWGDEDRYGRPRHGWR